MRLPCMSPATIMGSPVRHEHGTTSSPFVPAGLDACRSFESRQPVGIRRVWTGSDSEGGDASGFGRLQ